MQDHISPEPIRSMFDSDESHVAAWLAWADRTPGGRGARMADKVAFGLTAPDYVPSDWSGRPERGTELVRYVETRSPCCDAPVMIDPLVPGGSRGICSTCGTVLDDVGTVWVRRGPGPEAG